MIWRLTLPSEVIVLTYLFKQMFRLFELRADTWSFWQNDPVAIFKNLKIKIDGFLNEKRLKSRIHQIYRMCQNTYK